jgi:hypothetical protein
MNPKIGQQDFTQITLEMLEMEYTNAWETLAAI